VIETRGIGHIHLLVNDLDESLEFYTKAFGLVEAFRVDSKMVFLDIPGTSDVIVLHEIEKEKGSGESPRMHHFGLRIRDAEQLDTAVAQIEAAGGKVLERGKHAGEFPYAYVADPDGHVIEL
jgi:catechol 2,3-dioxygenase-like lactoylglutathione lyase family enzyme